MSLPRRAPPAGASAAGAAPRLRRVLGLGDLIFYGVVLIQPIGAIGPFGIANRMSHGHVTATILIALVAMMFTALSYGRMAALYPAAGSAYTYVGRGLNPHLGFVAGWVMLLDYLVIPVVNVVYGSLSAQRLVNDLAPGLAGRLLAPLGLPIDDGRAAFVFWACAFAGFMTLLNLRGIRWTARANQVLMGAMCLVIAAFVVQAVRHLWTSAGWTGLLSTEPFYNPRTFDFRAVCGATSLAALTYIGFDGITTLAEDVREPKRTVPAAIVLVCVLIGACAAIQVYLAQRVWPDPSTFRNLDTAFFDVCERVGGRVLFNAFALVVAVACLGSGLTGQVGAARLLFGMGRDGALPRCFARLDRRNNPSLNIWLMGGVALAGALWLDYERAATLINFGAFLAFLGVNLAAIREFVFRPPPGHARNWLLDLVAPALGFLFCLAIWVSLPIPAKVVGGAWCAIGLAYAAISTRGFRRQPRMIDFGDA